MNMNKIYFILLLLLTLTISGIKVEAASNTISYTCKCTNKNGSIDCNTSGCTVPNIKAQLQKICNVGGTTSGSINEATISYKCGTVIDSSPETACTKFFSTNPGGTDSKPVRATATCNPGEEYRIGQNFCSDTKETLRFLGYILFFVKILIPFGVIFMGTLDFYKAVIADKQDDLKKQAMTLGKRIMSGILIFFIPTLLNVSFTLINDWSNVSKEYDVCAECLLDPGNCN